jgi:cell division protein FtsN
MVINKLVLALSCVMVLALSGCSRQQSDWQKARETNTTDAYEQFLKKYPSGEFAAQAQARVKELYEERDWQKARDADTPEAYQVFLKQYPEGKWTEEARIRVENFTLAQTPSGSAAAPGTPLPGTADGGAPAAGAAASTSTASGSQAAGTGASASPKSSAAPKSSATPKTSAKPAASAEATPADSVAASGKSPGPYGVQLGAFKSGAAAAHRRWAHLRKEYPRLLAGLSSKVVPKKTSTGTLYRLQAFGATETRARTICKNLKAKSQACVVVQPTQA